jgi:hypothetical protein
MNADGMRRLLYVLALSFGAAACVGNAPPSGGDDVDAGGGDVDGSPDPALLSVSGKTLDYFTGAPLESVTLATEGMTPAASGSSDATGNYELEVPPGSVFYASATRANYRPTRSAPIRVAGDSLAMTDLTVVSVNDSRRQYASLGLTPTAGRAVLFGLLLRNNGMPLEGIPLTDIKLVDAQQAPVGLGPYFFGENGDLVSNLTLDVSTAFGGKARVGFLDVPPGTYTLAVTYTAGTGGGGGTPEIRTYEVPVEAVADGATLAQTGGGDDDMTPPAGARSFTTDVLPRLQKAANGGLGCANCHTAGGVAAILQYDLPVADAYAAIMGIPGVVNPPETAEQSLLLSKPLYEDPPNHPNATFLTTLDPDYVVILEWIQQGAPL